MFEGKTELKIAKLKGWSSWRLWKRTPEL